MFIGHGIMMVERVFETELSNIFTDNETQSAFMPQKWSIDAVFVLRNLQ